MHVPAIRPVTTSQTLPTQQSLVDVQSAPTFTQVVDGGWQRSTPPASGRQGVPPQHSDENAH